jgi:hypothetical protein
MKTLIGLELGFRVYQGVGFALPMKTLIGLELGFRVCVALELGFRVCRFEIRV